MIRHLVPLAALSLAACTGAPPTLPKTPAEAIALARRSGPELTAASALLDAGVVAEATAASAGCPDAPCRARVAADALEPYFVAATGLLWAVGAHRAVAPAGEAPAAGPDPARVYRSLGFAPGTDGAWCAAGVCVAGPAPEGQP